MFVRPVFIFLKLKLHPVSWQSNCGRRLSIDKGSHQSPPTGKDQIAHNCADMIEETIARCRAPSEKYFKCFRSHSTDLRRSGKVKNINGDGMSIWHAGQVINFPLTVPAVVFAFLLPFPVANSLDMALGVVGKLLLG